MASHYDLEEQEQLAQLKHFWAKYGNLITWALIAVLGTYAAWNGWQYWQRKTAYEAAALYDELERAAQGQDAAKVQRVWSDMQQQVGSTVQAAQAGLLAARALDDAGQADGVRQALQWVVENGKDDGLVASARLRLAGIEYAGQRWDAALKWLDAAVPDDYQPLIADRRGDVLLAQGQADAARQAYTEAWKGFAANVEYRRMVEAKLNALGVDPSATAGS